MNDQNSMPMKDDVSNIDKNVSANKGPVKAHQLEELKQGLYIHMYIDIFMYIILIFAFY